MTQTKIGGRRRGAGRPPEGDGWTHAKVRRSTKDRLKDVAARLGAKSQDEAMNAALDALEARL